MDITTLRRTIAADLLQMAGRATIDSIDNCSRPTQEGRSPPLEARAEDHQGEELEEHLGADHCGVGGRVVLRGDLDDVAADEVDADEAAQDRLRLARGQTAGLRRAGAGRKGRVEPVDIERD